MFLVRQVKRENYSDIAKREVEMFPIESIRLLRDTSQLFKQTLCNEFLEM